MPKLATGNAMIDTSEQEQQAGDSLQRLSALADGELDAEATQLACAHWRADAQARSFWHASHLIGDVMRSDELARDADRDAAFLDALRQRLADEPAVLAPTPSRRWLSWLAPAAVAAGFMALASTLIVTQGTPAGSASTGALTQSLAAAGASGSASAAEPQTLVADGKLVRDARLERYLAAHSQFGGASALGTPPGFLRTAVVQKPDR